MADPEPNPRLGRFVETPVAGEIVRAFVPPPLPPAPPIDVLALLERLSLAERALGRLDGITMLLPRQELFLYMYVRKEAVLSSQIEGTQSTLSDLLRFETEAQAGQPIDDIREVSNYVDAMMYGLERLEELPLSLRLIREMHERLLQSGRGGTKSPGEFRRSQNWIGGTRPGNALFVPPPITELDACLDALERFMHEDESRLPALIKAGLLHVQFETIHPVPGRQRPHRPLAGDAVPVRHGVLRKPLLYLSLYLKTHRADYYRLLQEVREHGAWEAWLDFFLDRRRRHRQPGVRRRHPHRRAVQSKTANASRPKASAPARRCASTIFFSRIPFSPRTCSSSGRDCRRPRSMPRSPIWNASASSRRSPDDGAAACSAIAAISPSSARAPIPSRRQPSWKDHRAD